MAKVNQHEEVNIKSKVAKFIMIILMAILIAPTGFANGDNEEDHGPPQEMVYLMYGMMLTMAGWMIYTFFIADRRYTSMEDFPNNYQQNSIPPEPIFNFAKASKPPFNKMEFLIINHKF